MSNELTTQKSLKEYFENGAVKKRFEDVLGKRSQGFVISVLSIAGQNELLSKADPASVVNAAMTAATLDLPINQNLGFAYIIPFNDRKSGKVVAQFQMGYKGFVQLAMRSGQFATINVTEVKDGEILGENRLTGEINFAWKNGDRDNFATVGYVAYMKLTNGFEKSLYMKTEQLKKHGTKYSQSAKRGYGLWNDDFDAMAKKTVLKLLLSKYAPLTTEMQTAQIADQAIIKGENEYEYIDNKKETPEEIAAAKEKVRIIMHINQSKTAQELSQCEEHLPDGETRKLFDERMDQLERKAAK